jgi:O-succinylbenzoate synthase
VSIGIQDSLDQLMAKIEKELSAGYQRIKIKIKPGWDLDAVERVRKTFGPIPLQVDANAAYSLEDAALLARLDPYELLLIEQPLDYDDVMDHAVLQQQIKTPVCLDESIHTVRIARDAIEAKACRIINIKPGRVGGHQASIELHDLAPRMAFRCGTAACSRAASAAPTISTWRACRIQPARRHRRQQALLPARSHRAGHRHRRRRHDRRAAGAGNWCQHSPRTD